MPGWKTIPGSVQTAILITAGVALYFTLSMLLRGGGSDIVEAEEERPFRVVTESDHLEYQVSLEERGIMFAAGPLFDRDGAPPRAGWWWSGPRPRDRSAPPRHRRASSSIVVPSCVRLMSIPARRPSMKRRRPCPRPALTSTRRRN